jgi:four helix bundle protein
MIESRSGRLVALCPDGTRRALTEGMTPEALKDRTKKFAVDIIRFAKTIPADHINRRIASQLTDAATSVAAHYRAVCRAKSRADFINKLSGGIEEADESALWLDSDGIWNLCAIGHQDTVERGRQTHSDSRPLT